MLFLLIAAHSVVASFTTAIGDHDGEKSFFDELVTALLLQVTVQRLKLLKLAALSY